MLMDGSRCTMHIAAATAIRFRRKDLVRQGIYGESTALSHTAAASSTPCGDPATLAAKNLAGSGFMTSPLGRAHDDVGRKEPSGKQVYDKSTRTCSCGSSEPLCGGGYGSPATRERQWRQAQQEMVRSQQQRASLPKQSLLVQEAGAARVSRGRHGRAWGHGQGLHAAPEHITSERASGTVGTKPTMFAGRRLLKQRAGPASQCCWGFMHDG